MRVTGFAVLEEISGRLSLMQSGEIAPPPQMRDGRLKFLFTEICQKIELYQPTVIALEDTFFAKNVKSALTLGQAKGVARLAAEINDLPVFEYAPTAVKMAVVGFGEATKDQIKEMVFQILKPAQRMNSEHEADAAAVAICHAHSAQWQAKVAVSAVR